MLPFILYFAAAVATAYHVLTLLTLALYGAPSDPLEMLALVGSLGLLIAAYVSLFRPPAAAKIALLAALLLWSFYGPAIAHQVRATFEKRSVLSESRAQPVAGKEHSAEVARPTRLSSVMSPGGTFQLR